MLPPVIVKVPEPELSAATYTPPPIYSGFGVSGFSLPVPPVMIPPGTSTMFSPVASSAANVHSRFVLSNLCTFSALLSFSVRFPLISTLITLPRVPVFWYFSTYPFKSSVTVRSTFSVASISISAASFTVVTVPSAIAATNVVWSATFCTFSVSPSAKAARGTRQSTMHRANRMLTSCFFIMSPSSRCWAAVPKVFIKIIGVKIANCQAFFEKTLRSIEKAKMQPNTRTICERNACMER